ncbi:hypothetical protein HY045_03450 [Candidatus Woesebacteria bacterium]|nr:hypothetical protein [Candidatus Woesebacteria bacterium]
MNISSYQHHLALVLKKEESHLFRNSSFIVFAVVLLVLGFASSLFYYQYKKDEPLRQEVQYLQFINGSFNTTRQGIDETLASFKIAGAKIKFIDSSKESTPQAAGFYSLLDDTQRSIDKIETLQKSLKFQKNLIKKEEVPAKYQAVTGDITGFYDVSIDNLEAAKGEQQFASDMLTASGLSFYLPVLSDETMWASRDTKAIKKYYEDKKLEANTALTSLGKLSVPGDFQNYYNNQIAYLTLFVETGNKIIDILNKEDNKNPEVATQLEQAYQLLNAAKKQNEVTAQTLLVERLKVFDTKRSLERFAQINLVSQNLGSKLADFNQNQDQPKTDQVFTKLRSIYPAFLQGLQISPII